MHTFNFQPKQDSFNSECARVRRKMMVYLKMYRKDHTYTNKLKWLKCDKESLKLSNNFKARFIRIHCDLSADDFLQHFTKSLDNSQPIKLCELIAVLIN